MKRRLIEVGSPGHPSSQRGWELERYGPEGPARVLLRLITRDHEAMRRAIGVMRSQAGNN